MMRDEFQSLFDRFFGDWPMTMGDTMTQNFFPRNWDLDLEEKDKEVVVRAELPGFEANNIDVHLANNVLTIEARKEVKEGKEGTENGNRNFMDQVRRSLTLPAGLDTSGTVDAHYRNGILEVHIPRVPEAQGRRIEVRTT
jgi:HSP20 family protein